jgi:hypothetical protein
VSRQQTKVSRQQTPEGNKRHLSLLLYISLYACDTLAHTYIHTYTFTVRVCVCVWCKCMCV